jgi:Fe-S-cluster-containing hydrogenase component 2
MEKVIVLDLDLCCGCESCRAACMQSHWGESRIKHGHIRDQAHLPSACRHCEDPLCAAACPTEALLKDEKTGLVVNRPFLCVGCQSCAFACPFGVIQQDLMRHIATKCDYCHDREEGPRCVASCSSFALKYVSVDELPKAPVNDRFIARSPSWRRE